MGVPSSFRGCPVFPAMFTGTAGASSCPPAEAALRAGVALLAPEPVPGAALLVLLPRALRALTLRQTRPGDTAGPVLLSDHRVRRHRGAGDGGSRIRGDQSLRRRRPDRPDRRGDHARRGGDGHDLDGLTAEPSLAGARADARSRLRSGIVAVRVSAVDVRVLLLDPDSPAAAIRAAEIGESPGSFGTGVRLTLDRAHLAAVIGGLPVGWLVVPCGASLAGRMIAAETQPPRGPAGRRGR